MTEGCVAECVTGYWGVEGYAIDVFSDWGYTTRYCGDLGDIETDTETSYQGKSSDMHLDDLVRSEAG